MTQEGRPLEVRREYGIEYEVLPIVFGTTIVIWLNQLVQTAPTIRKEVGMYLIITLVITFSLGVVGSSRITYTMARSGVSTGIIPNHIGLIVNILRNFIFNAICGGLATGYAYWVTSDLLFSFTFFISFMIFFGLFLYLSRQLIGG